LRSKYLSEEGFTAAREEYAAYQAAGVPALHIETTDRHFDHFINTWLPRQVYYHGDTNRLSTDPQTRNFLQDAMGSAWIRPDTSRKTILKALSQQNLDGSMPDGIKLYEGAELKYINQVPHTDHCVWLPMFLEAYLDETNDWAILDEMVLNPQTGQSISVRDRTSAAMRWLIQAVDHRGLHYIAQGDWNDPMNMVGYKGKGVSGWLSSAASFAYQLWAKICEESGQDASEFVKAAQTVNASINKHLWDGDWYGRGITDGDVVFGVKADVEGRIYLNSQSFALVCGAADAEKKAKMMKAVQEQLEGPFGVEMLGPAYTHMREDVGRLTEKFPGVAENGSYYNHAAAFYIYSLFGADEADKAWELLRKQLAGPFEDDYVTRGQLPIFVPNYYRGAWRQHPTAAGRSSHLFNTGTASWLYRSVIEGLFGLRGCKTGLRISPNLPTHWTEARVTRRFRGASFEIQIRRDNAVKQLQLTSSDATIKDGVVTSVEAGKTYHVQVVIPPSRTRK